MKVIFVTTNIKKYQEFKSLLNINVIHENIELDELQSNLECIIRDKSIQAYTILKKRYDESICVITDDVSLILDELKTLPGVYIKHFLKLGNDTLQKMFSSFSNRATVTCALALTYDNNGTIETKTAFGEVKGEIIFEAKCNEEEVFGFDKFFKPLGHEKTFAQMTIDEKNKYSHRSEAVRELIKKYQDTLLLKE